uniref:type II secretion system F family protein n=1 Tax=Streptomyces phytophilus TaxID=722715 RepID=UPI001C68DCFD
WVIGAVLAVAGVWNLPRLLAATATAQHTTERLDALAAWTEMLRDTLAAGAGLEQTITATAKTAPEAIRPHIVALADRLADGERLAPALRRLAAELGDPTADLVISALILSSEQQARQLGGRLGALATTAREQVEMRQRIQAGRARIRTTVRIVTGTTAGFLVALLIFNRAFLSPYDTATGQGMLVVVGAVFAAALVWLARLSRFDEPERFLAEPAGSETTR